MALFYKNKKLKLIRDGKEYNFENPFSSRFNYVCLGDSISAGHSINDEWETNYGENSQYGKNGNKSTVIVPNSFTDLIRKELHIDYGSNQVSVTSFARSGDAVSHLMKKLSESEVITEIKRANLVTICIGANDILGHVWPELWPYVETGDLSSLESKVENSLSILNDDNNANSYKSLFNRLNEINPNAKYVFTTVYNPYKYLWLDESVNGFFAPVLNTIPQMDIDVDEVIEDMFGIDDLGYPTFSNWKWGWQSIELNIDLDGMIKNGLLSTSIVRKLFDRVNGLCDWVEKYVEGTDTFNGLNRILKNKINEYRSINPNFYVVDTKALYDTYPDRPVTADIHYNDLVNVEYTRGYNTALMDWGALWRNEYGNNVAQYWGDLAWKYLSFSNAFPSTNVFDYVSFDLEGFARDLVMQMINKVIVPDIDPHPENYGHIVLKESFYSVLK